MAMTLAVSLYVSRIILDKLGILDFGIYTTVNSIVLFVSLFNNALGTGTSRFITVAVGKESNKLISETFSTALTAHIVLAFFTLLVSYFCGSIYLDYYSNIPECRLSSAKIVFIITLISSLFSLTQTPFLSMIIAHENMQVFAYISLIDATLKVIICYLLDLVDIDKLVTYSFLYCIVQIIILSSYRLYCYKCYKEYRYNIKQYKPQLLVDIIKFSFWSLFASCSLALNNQGVIFILNSFFSPSIVAARAISVQINSAFNLFIDNIRTAVSPQIVKLYTTNQQEKSKDVLLATTRYSFYCMLLLTLPVIFLTESLLNIWLIEVPPYAVIFTRLIIVQVLFQVFDSSFYIALYAKGRLIENALISPVLGFIQFPILCFLFKEGYSPTVLSWSSMILYFLLGIIVKPFLLKYVAYYCLSSVYKDLIICAFVAVFSTISPLIFKWIIDINSIQNDLFCLFICIISTLLSIWFIGLTKDEKDKIISLVKKLFFSTTKSR